MLELVAMILFIGATIFIGGPTIIRGINAHFKLWDDSVQDSYNDPLTQAPQQNMPADCVCDPPIGGPGLRCGISPCPRTRRLETILCNPVGCGVALGITENYCVDDPTCCDPWYDTTLCGLGGAAPDCPLGERIQQRLCGMGRIEFRCRPDSDPVSVDGNPSCVPHCIGSYHPNESAAASNPYLPVICPGDDTNITGPGLINYNGGVGMSISLYGKTVLACSHPPVPGPDNKCETYCLPGYMPSGMSCVPNYCMVSFIQAAEILPARRPRNRYSPSIITNNASFTVCEGRTVGAVTLTGCGNPGLPGYSCTMNILPVNGGAGFEWCAVNFYAAHLFPMNMSINMSFTQCEAGNLVSATISGANCGNPAVPSSYCSLTIY